MNNSTSSNINLFIFALKINPKIIIMSTQTQSMNYKVKDITLADWGRKEIKLAEAEMPGLMAL